MDSNNMTNSTIASGEITGTAGDASKLNAFEDEMPGWIWVLTIQGEVPERFEQLVDEDEEDDDDFDGDIVGCYTTKALMVADMKRMGQNRYGIFHMKLEGWTKP